MNNTPKINVIQQMVFHNGTRINNFRENRNHIESSIAQNSANHSASHSANHSTSHSANQNTSHSASHSIKSIGNVNQISRNNQNVDKTSETGTNSRDFKPFGSRPGEKLFILTGTVERIIQWNTLLSNQFCYFEVIAAVVSLQEGNVRTQKIMLLRDRSGPILQVIYYFLTHLAIEDFHLGKMIRCVGKMIGPNIINAISIRDASNDEVESLHRLTLISEQAVTTHLRS